MTGLRASSLKLADPEGQVPGPAFQKVSYPSFALRRSDSTFRCSFDICERVHGIKGTLASCGERFHPHSLDSRIQRTFVSMNTSCDLNLLNDYVKGSQCYYNLIVFSLFIIDCYNIKLSFFLILRIDGKK